MTPPNNKLNPESETQNLLKKLLILELFKLDVPQAAIAKKLKMDILVVNDLLKGIKKKHE